MAAKFNHDVAQGQEITNGVKNWMMVALTLVFVLLYGAALAGWLKPLADDRMVARLEPVIFVIVGYYFGRLPSQQNEKALKDEITRQAQKADAAQHSKEQAQQAREALEEKLKNVKVALASAPSGAAVKGSSENPDAAGGQLKEDALRHAVAAALGILNS